MGIAPEEIGKIFEPFTQTESGKKIREGTGLGMSISQNFIRKMGGDISVQSELGKGTTFWFDIQARMLKVSNIPRAQISRQVIGLEPNQPKFRILIVDDNKINRFLLSNLLQPLELDIREAENGQQAIDMWEQFQPHLIWMDMRMPIMNGYEATKNIKSSISHQAPIIIALTASVYEHEKATTLAAGCDDFLQKPFRETAIFELLEKHLKLRYIYKEDA